MAVYYGNQLISMQFDWLTYFRELATFAGIDRIDASEPIIVQSPSYFRNLSKVLHSSNISQTWETFAVMESIITIIIIIMFNLLEIYKIMHSCGSFILFLNIWAKNLELFSVILYQP